MINKQTQNAWLAYMRSQAGNAKFLIAKDYDSGVVQDIEKPVRDGFDAGYAAAIADCEAKVRAAVEATIEEAAKIMCTSCFREKPVKREHAKTWVHPDLDAWCQASDLRALDASAIVARVMRKE